MVQIVEASTHLGLHAPVAGHVQALLPQRLPRLVRAVAFPPAGGAVLNVLRRARAPQPRHRPLDDVVLAHRHPERSLAALRLVEPRPLHRRRRLAPPPPARVPVGEVRLQGFRLCRRGHPIDSRRRLLAGPVLGFPQPVEVPQVGQRRAHQRGRLARLLCAPLECRGVGGWPQRASPPASQETVLPGVACPPGGPVGRSSPPSRPAGVAHSPSGRRAATTATTPSRRPAVVPRAPRPPGDPLRHSSQVPGPRHPAGLGGVLPRLPDPAMPQERRGAPTCSDPSAAMPRSQTPVVSWALALAHPGLLPSGACKPSVFPSIPRRVIRWSTTR